MAKLDLQNYKNRHSFRSKVFRMIWNFVWVVFFRFTPNHFKVFNSWRIFLLRIFGAKVGNFCVVKNSCEIWQPWKLEIGDYVALSERVVCYSVDKIRIGNQTTISREAFLCCASHDTASSNMELTAAPIIIGDNCWVAARAILLPGIRVGNGAVVAAGSVVVKDIAPWTVVGGNPANVIKKRILAN